jgi:alkylation response protein AidB-like acyl-CoA dehydrogenase
MAIQVDSARFLSYQAGWAIAAGVPSERQVRMAKAWTSEAYRKTCFDAHQVHGAIGFTAEHDLHLYTRRAKLSELAYGDGPTHRRALASVMGLSS